ncbi:MAG: hypothetical protein CMM93_08720 [Rickettsiales bacterium]|nr:hypothetical protein [Rickettsiales bacterium]
MLHNGTAKSVNAKKAELKKATDKVEAILNPTAEKRINKLETLQILSEKYKAVKEKTDDLTNYRASNDDTQARMEFKAQNGYSFSISNNAVIEEVLNVVENKLFAMLEKSEKEIIDFQI